MCHFRLAGAFILMLGALLALLPVSAAAQDNAPDTWIKRCAGEDQTYCEIFQRLVEKETQTRVAEFALGIPEENGNVRGVIILPLGILLPEKVRMQVDEDGSVYSFNIRYCTQGGCFGFIDMDKTLLEEMKMGGELHISFVTMQGEKYTVDLSLIGFTDAFEQL